MSIYISKNDRRLGPFDDAKVRSMLDGGELAPDDLAIRHGEIEWRRLSAMIPAPLGRSQRRRNRIFLGGVGFLVLSILTAGILGVLADRNLRPADSFNDLPTMVKDFKLGERYPPKGNIWGTESTFVGVYSDATKTNTLIYMMTVFSSEPAAEDAFRRELAASCRAGETPMYFKFVKDGAERSEGATCALPFFVRRGKRLVTLGGGAANTETFIKFAENLPFNDGAEMKKQ
jgi:hypothetical protein